MAQFFAPFWVIPPVAQLADQMVFKAFIPMDDTHTMVVNIQDTKTFTPRLMKSGGPIPGLGGPRAKPEYRPNTTDWFGRWRLVNCAENDYLIDREAQRHGGVFSGIFGLPVQDAAVGGMLGPLADRTLEHLVSSDVVIVRLRRKLLQRLETLAQNPAAALPGVDDPGLYRTQRAGNFSAPAAQPFRDAYEEAIHKIRNVGATMVAE
jgi:hypothetical protein